MSKDIYSRILDRTAPPVVIAEAGINHNGDIGKAKELVVAAAEAGADVVKFQTHFPEHEMLREGFTADYVGGSLFDLLKKMVLTEEQHLELIKLSREKGIVFLSTPFSKEAADVLERLDIELFKVGSGEATNLPLLGHIARKGRPMIISSGMTELGELKETVEFVQKINPRLVLMQCTSTYPTAYKDVRLRLIGRLQKEFPDIPVGLSDHSMGVYTAIASVALGARAIEKHFTISRRWEGPDQSASIEPNELAELVKGSRAVFEAMSLDEKYILDEERQVQKMARESVVVMKDMAAGEVFDEGNLWVKRPGTGIPAREYFGILGKRAARPLKAGTLLKREDIAD